jgi:hypothetical protein
MIHGVLAALLTLAIPAVSPAPPIDGSIGDAWKAAAAAALTGDFTYRRPSQEPTRVLVTQDGSALYVAFDVTQHEGITASQHTNGSSVENDDYVAVFLFPQGSQGFQYSFYANPNGARYQVSSENSAYAPEWQAAAKRSASGYTVTLRIPLGVIRGGAAHTWKAQFARFTVATNSVDVWSYASNATSVTDPTFAGTITGVGIAPDGSKSSTHNPLRIQPYALGEATSRLNGGSTSRIGADLSIPFTPTASFVATLHPDYSNVESDQQTIAPTAFTRQYSEVRPFFTQLSSFFNSHESCDNCPQTLYTPAIPIFSQGYGIEGTQGRFNFAGFDAIGLDRTDQAQTINYQYSDQQASYQINAQRVNVSAYGVQDNTTTLDGGYYDPRTHWLVYTNNGVESGTLVTDPSLASYHDYGFGYVDALTTVAGGAERVGAQFSPLDGYTAQSDILGWQMYTMHTFNFPRTSLLHDIMYSGYFARFDNHFGERAQTDTEPQLNFDFRDLMTVHVYAGVQDIRTAAGEWLPFEQNGAMVGYRFNTNTPTYVMYSGGPYYHGKLDAWTYLTTLPLARRVHLTLETDEDRYMTAYASEQSTTQWLERTSLDWQFSRELQFDIGARRIVGGNLPASYAALTYDPSACNANPYLPGCFLDSGNVSVALHFLAARNEFYLVYGNANNLSTEPALFFKWIRYVGAEKGT